MNKKKIGFKKLVSEIGVEFFNDHKNTACFSCGDTEQGLYCFLGIEKYILNPYIKQDVFMEIKDTKKLADIEKMQRILLTL